MPVVIKELVVRVTVDSGSPSESSPSQNAPTAVQESQNHHLIAACVKQVLEILNEKKER